MAENDIAVFFLCAVGVIALFKTAFDWYSDLSFYRTANWDFTKDSGKRLKVGNFRGMKGKPISNKARVIYVYPAMLLVICIFLLLLACSFSTGNFALR